MTKYIKKNKKKLKTSESYMKRKKKINRFPGDFETFIKSDERKKFLKKATEKVEKDKQHPVYGKHAAWDRLVNAGKIEQKAYKEYRKNGADIREKARSNKKKYGTSNLL